MDFSSHIDSLSSARDSIVGAIRAKGVYAPNKARISELPDYISKIGGDAEGYSGRLFVIQHGDGTTQTEGVPSYLSPMYELFKGAFTNPRDLVSITVISSDGGTEADSWTSCYEMFSGCTALTSLTFVGDFGSRVGSANDMFKGCASLMSISGTMNMAVGFDLSETRLTNTSVMNVIDTLCDWSVSGDGQTLALGSLLENLSTEQTIEAIRIATQKGWALR